MIIDALILGYSVPYRRQVHFWAKHTLFGNKIAASILTSIGAVPVDRTSRNNADLFRGSLECLDANKVIAVFPEGTSYTLPHLLELKDGLSWLSLEHLTAVVNKYGSVEKAGMNLASLVPAGITYLNKEKWRSVVIVAYGRPIDLSTYLEDFRADPKKAVKRLTREITKSMREITVNAPDWDTLHAADTARTILVPDDVILVENYVKTMQSCINILAVDKQDGEEDATPIQSPVTRSRNVSISSLAEATTTTTSPSAWMETIPYLRRQLLCYRSLLDEFNLSDPDINSYSHRELTPLYLTFRLIVHFVRFLIELPLFFPGFIFHVPVYMLARWIDGAEKYEECKAQNKIFAMLLVLPIQYLLLFRYLWYSLFGPTVAGLFAAAALTVTFSIYHVALVDDRYELIRNLLASWRMWNVVVFGRMSGDDGKGKSRMEEVVEMRRECVVNLGKLLESAKNDGISEATYLASFLGKAAFASSS